MKKLLPTWAQSILVGAIVLTTFGAFGYFFATHPAVVESIKNISPWLLVWLLVLYGVFTVVLAVIYDFTLRICGHRLHLRENVLLTAYSSIVNFFGPLQSGPGVRAVYLKRHHGVRLRDYTLATLLYYAFFAIFSAAFLLLGSTHWWLALGLIGIVALGCYGVIRWSFKRAARSNQAPRLVFSVANLAGLGIATLAQVALVAIIYFVELHAVSPNISLRQAMTYSGAANFALFVSLTPGAIGFRESFLLFSKGLHRISTANVLAASLIDRAVYVVFLGFAFVALLLFHGTKRFAGSRR